MASGLLSLLNGGGKLATPLNVPQEVSSSTPPSSGTTTIDQLFARLEAGATPGSKPGPITDSPAMIPLPVSQASSPFGAPQSQNGQNAFPGLHTPTPNPASRSSQLLGLLAPGGPAPSSLDYVPHGTGTPAPLGVIGSPSPIGMVAPARSPPPKEDRAQNLLAALMGGSSGPSILPKQQPHLALTHQQPLIHHATPSQAPTAAPLASELPAPRVKSPEIKHSPLPPVETAKASPAAAAKSPTPVEPRKDVTPLPKKPLFSFISPFDAFDEPIAKPKAAPATPSPAPSGLAPGAGKKAGNAKKEKGKGKRANPGVESSASAKGDETDTSRVSRRSSTSQAEKVAPTPVKKEDTSATQTYNPEQTDKQATGLTSAASTVPAASPATPRSSARIASESSPRTPSAVAPQVPEASTPTSTPVKRKAPPLKIPYPASSFKDSNTKTNNFQEYHGTRLAIDISEPNQAGIVHDVKAVVDRKISLVTNDVMTIGPVMEGKTVAVGGRMAAYALSKYGRIRVLDQDTGHNALIEFPVDSEGKAQKVWDLAVSADHYCAAVSANGWLAVWQINVKVTALNGEPNLTCDLVATLQPEECGAAWKVMFSNDGRSPWVLVDNVVQQFTLSQGTTTLTPRKVVSAGEATPVDFTISDSGFILLLSEDGNIHGSHMTDGTKFTAQVPFTVSAGGVDISCSSLSAFADNLLVSYGRGRVWKVVRLQSLQSDGMDSNALDIFFEGNAMVAADVGLGVSAFDSDSQILYLSCFPRSSLFTLSIREEEGGRWSVRYAELATESIGSLAVSSLARGGGESELFMKNPKGFNQIAFQSEYTRALIGPKQAPKASKLALSTSKVRAATKETKTVRPTDAAAIKAENVPKAPSSAPPVKKEPVSEPAPQSAEPAPMADIKLESEDLPLPDVKDTAEAPQAVASAISAQAGGSFAAVRSSKNDSSQNADSSQAGITPQQLQQLEDSLFARLDKSFAESLRVSGATQLAQIEKAQRASQVADSERQENVLRLVSEALNRGVKEALSSVVHREIQTSVLPAIVETIKAQVELMAGPELVKAVNKNVQDVVMAELEKQLVPNLATTFTSVLSPIVEKNIKAAIERDLSPRHMHALQTGNEAVLTLVRDEWQALRRSHLEQLKTPKSPDPAVQEISTQIAELQLQMKTLSEDVLIIKSRPQPHSPIGMTSIPAAHPNQVNQGGTSGPIHLNGQNLSGSVAPPPHHLLSPAPHPIIPAPASQEDAEEVFLSAFSTLSDDALVDFVMRRESQTAFYLPNPAAGAGKGPLSQAVLLTMIHKLSKCLEGKAPTAPVFQICLGWVFRASYLIDSRDPSIAAYLPQIKEALNQQFRAVIASFGRFTSNDPIMQQSKVAAASTMEQIIRRLA